MVGQPRPCQAALDKPWGPPHDHTSDNRGQRNLYVSRSTQKEACPSDALALP